MAGRGSKNTALGLQPRDSKQMIWLKAAFVGVLLPPLLGSIYYCYLFLGSSSPFSLPIYLATILLSYWVVVLIGLPAVIAFKSQKTIELKLSIFVGMFVALLTAFVLFAFSFVFPPLSQLVVFGFMGLIAGVAAWYVFK